MTRARDVANLIGSGNYSSTTFTATAGQTAFTISHTQGFIQVFMNGLLLDETVDYTSNGSAVTLTSAAAAGDEIEVVAYNTFSVGDALNQAAADTRYVNASGDTMTGTLVAGTRLQVGDSSITQAYPQANFGYVADFQGSTGTQTYISIAAPNASSVGDNGVVIGEDATDTYITQRGNKNIKLATQDLSRLVIDGSGRVTTPYNPYFWAQAANVGASDYSSGSVIFIGGGVNSNTISDIGGHFSTSTGRFTAPVSGVYHFSAVVRIDNFGGTYSYLTLWDSGSVAFCRDLTSLTATYNTQTVAGSRYLSANDYVYCSLVTASDTSVTVSSDSYFSGHLVG